MRSVLLTGLRSIELADTAPPDGPGPDDILVRIRAVGLCGSDMHWYLDGRVGHYPARFPMILGHEPVGEVIETGANVRHLKVGDRVALEPSITCGHCEHCLSGSPNNCTKGVIMGSPFLPGCLRDQVVLPAHNADPIPEALTWQQAALMEPLAVLVHTFDLVHLKPGDTVAVLGTGAIGLLAIAMARLAGAQQIFALDRVPHRAAMARAMGATVAVTSNLQEPVGDLTRGRGVDWVFDAAGAVETINLGLALLRPGGHFVLIGIPSERDLNIDLYTAMMKELRVTTIKRSNHRGAAAGALLAQGLIPTSILTHALPLERASEGFQMLADYSDGVGKIVFDLSL